MPKGTPKHTPAKPRFTKSPKITPVEIVDDSMALVPVSPRLPFGGKRGMGGKPGRKNSGIPYDRKRVTKPETQEQREAFDFYLALGDGRNTTEVATHFKRNPQTIHMWSSKFKWVSRAKQHEAEHADTLLIEPHATQQEKRKFGLQMIDKILRNTVTMNPDGTIASCSVDAKSPSDLRTLLTLRDELLNPERGSKTTFGKGSSFNAENAVFIIKK